MFLYHTSDRIAKAFPRVIFHGDRSEKTLYLTFDDGPHPSITPWVLDKLDLYEAKASFFCVGDNIRKHPETYAQVLQRGHSVGNHTFNHLNGWKTKTERYLTNIEECADYCDSRLFRPPYGKITLGQLNSLYDSYKVVYWDVLSGDFDKSKTEKQCWDHLTKHIEGGSVVVFHDSAKAEDKLKALLPKVLERYSNFGFKFANLSEFSLNAP